MNFWGIMVRGRRGVSVFCLVVLIWFLLGLVACNVIPRPSVPSGIATQATSSLISAKDTTVGTNPSSLFFWQIGAWLTVIGTVFGALTKFRTGWGLSVAASGLLMILLAWVFAQPWLPWVSLAVLLAYVSYKVWNRLSGQNPLTSTKVEHPLE